MSEMCKQEHFYFAACDHWNRQILSVCRNRDKPNICRQGPVTKFHSNDPCLCCLRAEMDQSFKEILKRHFTREMDEARKRYPVPWVRRSKPKKLSSADERTHIPRCAPKYVCPRLADESSDEDEHFETNAFREKKAQKTLQQLKLADRFHERVNLIKTPTFISVSYTSSLDAQSDESDSSSTEAASPSSVYSPSASPPSSPTSLFHPTNALVRTHTIGRKHARCKVKVKKPAAKCGDERPVEYELDRCRYGTHKVLDQFGDVPSESLCWWHSVHKLVQEQSQACKALGEDGT